MDRKLKIGDTIKIKNGTIDPEFGMDIGGWYGQIANQKIRCLKSSHLIW